MDAYSRSYSVDVTSAAVDRLSTEGKQPCCLNAHYRVQCVKTRAAAGVLVLSAGVFSSVCLLRSLLFVKILATSLPCPWCVTLNFVLTFTAVVVYPLPGYLADVYWQRFGVMKCGLFLIWSGALATVVVSLLDSDYYVNQYVDASSLKPVYITLLVLVSLGTSAFHANIVPFGLEQLHASSSEEIVAFMHSYLWVEMLGVAVAYVFSCLPLQGLHVALLCFTLTTLVVVGMVASQYHVVIERTSKPLSLKHVLQVLRRSTHKGINPSGRHVNEAKAALRILFILVLFGLTTYTNVAGIFIVDLLSSEFSPGSEPPKQVCYLKVASISLPFLLVVPLYHFILHPLFHRYVPGILNRAVAGLFLYTLGALSLFVLETVGRYSLKVEDAPCFLAMVVPSIGPTLNLSYHWLVLVHIINAMGLFAVTSAIYEFISAKSPYSARGLMVGLMYASSGVGRLAGFGVLLGFRYGYVSLGIDQSPCELWYYATNVALSVVSLCVFVLAVKIYELRQNASATQDVDHWSYQSTNL